MHVLRGAASGMSDHFSVEGRIRVRWKSWRRSERRHESGEVVKVSELPDVEKKNEYQVKLERKFECMKAVENVEEEWMNFKCAVLETAKEVCGMRRVGRKIRKGSEWWNEVVKDAVERKKRAYEVWLKCKTAEKYESYKVEERQ